jgi:hypothetical protein
LAKVQCISASDTKMRKRNMRWCMVPGKFPRVQELVLPNIGERKDIAIIGGGPTLNDTNRGHASRGGRASRHANRDRRAKRGRRANGRRRHASARRGKIGREGDERQRERRNENRHELLHLERPLERVRSATRLSMALLGQWS